MLTSAPTPQWAAKQTAQSVERSLTTTQLDLSATAARRRATDLALEKAVVLCVNDRPQRHALRQTAPVLLNQTGGGAACARDRVRKPTRVHMRAVWAAETVDPAATGGAAGCVRG